MYPYMENEGDFSPPHVPFFCYFRLHIASPPPMWYAEREKNEGSRL